MENLSLPRVTGLTADSRNVQPGNLFVAIAGAHHNGAAYIHSAIEKGATAIAAPESFLKNLPENITVIPTDNPREFLAIAAAAFYQSALAQTVAVTGTNGKTSTVNFVRQLWEKSGVNGASIGTLGVIGKGFDGYSGMTTPDPVWLHKTVKEIAENEIDHLAIEASSIGIEQHRLDGLKISAAAFTNLTRDHLDYHGSMEEYKISKLRLFADLLIEKGVAVVNADTPEFPEIKAICEKRMIRVWGYGRAAKELRLIDRKPVAHGQIISVEIFGQHYTLTLPLVGEFQAMNILCAIGLVLAGNPVDHALIIKAAETVSPIPGRLQQVPDAKAGTAIYVDYAHTPDALENILLALRPHTNGRLISLIGCGGDRDKGKRPIMGEISCRLADITIVTDDNPRSEDPDEIRADIMVACNEKAIEIGDRRKAIKESVSMLRNGDVLVLAGKGHEQGQIFADHTEPFDDLTEARNAIKEAF